MNTSKINFKIFSVSGSDLVKVLSRLGFQHIRTRGSHAILKRQTVNGSKTIPVPLHKELAKGTLKSIMNQADITLEQLISLL